MRKGVGPIADNRGMDLQRAAELARDLVTAAGELARGLQGHVEVRDKGQGLGPVTEADLRAERLILAGLRHACEDPVILSEETLHSIPPGAGTVWCVDPIDGTREFSEGRPEYAVMVGLLVGGRPVAGAMALPGEGHVFWGWEGGGAFVDGRAIRLDPVADLDGAIAIHSRSHRGPGLRDALERLGVRRTRAAGSVGYKVGQILLGHAHVYVHVRGGTMWWDSVGPAAILLAAGGFAGDARGNPLDYAGAPDHPDGLLFTAPGLAAAACERLRVE